MFVCVQFFLSPVRYEVLFLPTLFTMVILIICSTLRYIFSVFAFHFRVGLVLFIFWYVKGTCVKHYYGSGSLNFEERYTQRSVTSSLSLDSFEFPLPPFFCLFPIHPPVGDQFLFIYLFLKAYSSWIPFAVMSRHMCVFLHFLFYMEGPLYRFCLAPGFFFFINSVSWKSLHIRSYA